MVFKAGTEHEGKYTGQLENGERSGQGKFKWTSKERKDNFSFTINYSPFITAVTGCNEDEE